MNRPRSTIVLLLKYKTNLDVVYIILGLVLIILGVDY